jgi:hypothetical protein
MSTESKKKWREKNREREAEYYRERRANDPEYKAKCKARKRARYLEEIKKLKKEPCFYCNDPDTEKHHPDYSKPEEVIYVCRKCHSDLHRANYTGSAVCL